MFNLSLNTTLKLIILVSFFALSSAYFIEYVLGHLPCTLCKIQRIPYIASLILISLYFILNSKNKTIPILLILIFIIGTGVSAYHVGIEQDFFNESFLCQLQNNTNATTPHELLAQLKTNTISCKNVPITFFGLSLATLNTLLSFLISVILFKTIKFYE